MMIAQASHVLAMADLCRSPSRRWVCIALLAASVALAHAHKPKPLKAWSKVNWDAVDKRASAPMRQIDTGSPRPSDAHAHGLLHARETHTIEAHPPLTCRVRARGRPGAVALRGRGRAEADGPAERLPTGAAAGRRAEVRPASTQSHVAERGWAPMRRLCDHASLTRGVACTTTAHHPVPSRTASSPAACPARSTSTRRRPQGRRCCS